MPGKSRRVAARQSQLNRRRKKQQRGPSWTPPVVAARTEVDDRPTDEATAQPIQTPVPAPASRHAIPTAPQPGPVSPPRAARIRRERPDAYNYVMPEIRRIVAMACVVVAAIAILGLLL